MRLPYLFLCFGILLGFSMTPMVHALPEQDYSQMSPTVQVISNTYTKNDQVIRISRGSGTIISPQGLVLTNNHVVEKDDDEAHDVFEICITFDAQEEPLCEYTASIIERNREMDLALLQIHSLDIRGNKVPLLKSLSYTADIDLEEEDEIFAHGYPGIGGKTITITKGQVSGFEENNQFSYIKTDTVISFGNSGGTVLDADGNFIGVPTFIQFDADALGYFLDIREATEWIDENKNKDFEFQKHMHSRLAERLVLINDAKETKKYTHPYYPEFTFQLPDDWEFTRIDRYLVSITSKNRIKDYEISFSLQDFGFELTPEYLQEILFKKLEKNKEERYKNYERKEEKLWGIDGHTITYSFLDTTSVIHILPYGGTLMVISYEYDLKEEEEDVAAYQEILDGVEFADTPFVPVLREKLERKTPAFSVSNVPGWYLLENQDPYDEDLIVTLSRPDNPEGTMYISHFELTETDKKLSNEEFLDNILRRHESTADFRLVSKNENVVVDGLSGVSLTYTYQGEELNQTRKISKVYLRDADDYYFIRYDDVDTFYQTFLPDFKKVLESFKNLNEKTMVDNGAYDIGTLNSVFEDITHHRYAQSISKLKDDGILEGYRDNTFRPEKPVSRGEALKIMLEAKVISEKKKEDGTTLEEELDEMGEDAHQEFDFEDTKDMKWLRKYVRYARSKRIVQGYSDTFFVPNDTVTLSQATKMLFGIYELPVWDPSTTTSVHSIAWYKPYIDTAFDLQIIPYGMYDPHHELTRAELAYIIDTFLQKDR